MECEWGQRWVGLEIALLVLTDPIGPMNAAHAATALGTDISLLVWDVCRNQSLGSRCLWIDRGERVWNGSCERNMLLEESGVVGELVCILGGYTGPVLLAGTIETEPTLSIDLLARLHAFTASLTGSWKTQDRWSPGIGLDGEPWPNMGVNSFQLDHPGLEAVEKVIPDSDDMVETQDVVIMVQLDWGCLVTST